MRRKMLETGSWAAAMMLAFLFCAGPALSQDPYIYPNKGQTPQQQDKDKYECYSWAVRQTGFDPMKQPSATTPPPTQEARRGGVVRGAAGGAALGAVGGAIGGDAGKGAAIGAGVGALFGGMRRRHQRREQRYRQDQWAQQQAGQYQARRSEYDRAFGACMRGRGYTIG